MPNRLPKLKQQSDGKAACAAGSEIWKEAAMASTGSAEYDVAKKLLTEAVSIFPLVEDQTGAMNQGMAIMNGIPWRPRPSAVI